MKLRPAGHRVLVKLKKVDEEKVSAGGIVIAEAGSRTQKQYATQEAYVVELGPTAYKAFDDGEPWCKVGDLVLITKYSGEDREDPKTKEVYRIILDEDIVAVVEEE